MRHLVLLVLTVLTLFFLQSLSVGAQLATLPLYATSPYNQPIPSGAQYIRDDRIGSFRHSSEEYLTPVYRIAPGTNVPLVTVSNAYGWVQQWPIPTYAVPATGSDGHMAVIHFDNGLVYEFYRAQWTNATTLTSSSMQVYPLNGSGISTDNRRVTASGIANTNGMVMVEDFWNGAAFDTTRSINHALSLLLPYSLLASNAFIPPAVGGETGSGTVPMGARYALPPDLNVDALSVHPFTRALLRAARDYGMYVVDGSGTPLSNGLAVGVIEIEPGLLQQMFGVPGDSLMDQVQSEIFSVIQASGIFNVPLVLNGLTYSINGITYPDGTVRPFNSGPPTCVEMNSLDFIVPPGLYCVVLMRDGEVINTPGAVPQELIDAGVILAVEVVYYVEAGITSNTFDTYRQVCLNGEGRFIYLDGTQSPRVPIEMTSTYENGFTCAWIPNPGTIVLIAPG